MKSKTVTKSNLERIAGPLAVGVVLAGVLTAWAAPSPAPAPAPPAEEVAPPKSVFVDRVDFGKDPFFPTSTRRGKVTTVSTNTIVEPQANFSNLALKGISTLKEKRLAIINNKTFEANEEAAVRVNGLLVNVKCIEVRD